MNIYQFKKIEIAGVGGTVRKKLVCMVYLFDHCRVCSISKLRNNSNINICDYITFLTDVFDTHLWDRSNLKR